MATSEMLKGAEVAAIVQARKDQQKASDIMAERLPGLTDSNAPAPGAVPSGENQAVPPATPAPVAPKLLPARHPDRFTPGAKPQALQKDAHQPTTPAERNPTP
jgi:rod shape-determining protein MreC